MTKKKSAGRSRRKTAAERKREKEYQAEYRARPEVRRRMAALRKSPEYIKREKARWSDPEFKERRREYMTQRTSEPLLGPLPRIKLKGIDWVIVGGESGPGARVMQKKWVEQARDQCLKKNVAFFFKQWGGVRKSATGRVLNGRTWDETPKKYMISY